MKSILLKGVVYRRESRDDSRSLDTITEAKSDMKDNPNTVIPGVSLWTSKRDTGMFFCIVERRNIKTRGKPKPKNRLIGSRRISLAVIDERTIHFIVLPPLSWR